MILSNKSILEERDRGSILIHPFNPENISTSSYDLRLGEHFFRQTAPGPRDPKPIYNIWDKRSVKRVWDAQNPRKAVSVQSLFGTSQIDWKDPDTGIKDSDLIIMLDPGETILGHTIEFIGGVKDITTSMQARSSMGRSGIEVCKCAGWGDVGYVNRWTMEITNNSRFYQIPLVVGRRVAQLVFFRTDPVQGENYSAQGKYSGSLDVEELERKWEPELMLPRLYLDREQK